jgi:hypothetical protein
VRCGAGGAPERWSGSWLAVRTLRPRVRLETGVYVLRSTYIKDRGPQSMWSVDNSPFCQIHHYRDLLFRPRGELLYASTPLGPEQMRRRFKRRLFEELLEEGRLREAHGDVAAPEPSDAAAGGAAPLRAQPQPPALPQPLPQPQPPAPRGGAASPGSSTQMSQRQQARLARERRKLDPTKADTIYRGAYSVSGDELSAVINLVNFSVTLVLGTEARAGSHDRLHLRRHQSVYHKPDEPVIDYALSRHKRETLFEYYSFSYTLVNDRGPS